MKKFHIGFSLNQNRITIPHYDYRGFLVGVRSRALEEKDLEFGKYYYDVQLSTIDGEVFTLIGPCEFILMEEITND